MKSSIFYFALAVLFVFSASTGFAQNQGYTSGSAVVSLATAPNLTWKTQHIDNGTVAVGEELTMTYQFVNEGAEAIKIFKVKPSCGCTGVDYSRESIAPGETAFVSATYKAKHKGYFTKTVQVFTAEGAKPIILTFKGEASEQME